MQKDTSSDQELNLKKRARRRLVGAIALVLLMIIVLPMLLKDRAASQPQDKITITLPSEQQTVIPAAPSDFDSSIVPTEPPTPSAESTGSAIDPEAIAKPEKEPSAPVAKEPVVKDAVVKESAKPAEDKKHHFYVQIGVFSDEANVKQLQGKLTDLGYKSQTEKINTDKGQKIRLKTQIFSDRNEAAIALQNIKDAGLTGMVVSQ